MYKIQHNSKGPRKTSGQIIQYCIFFEYVIYKTRLRDNLLHKKIQNVHTKLTIHVYICIMKYKPALNENFMLCIQLLSTLAQRMNAD